MKAARLSLLAVSFSSPEKQLPLSLEACDGEGYRNSQSQVIFVCPSHSSTTALQRKVGREEGWFHLHLPS